MRVDKATWRLTSYIVDLIFIIKKHPARKWHFSKSTPPDDDYRNQWFIK